MFKLQDMRHQKHIGWGIKIVFALVIVSFVFFYGWRPDFRGDSSRAFARVRSGSLNPFKQWRTLTTQELKSAEEDAAIDKVRMLPPQAQQMVMQTGGMNRLVTTQEVARTAANNLLMQREAEEMNLVVPEERIINLLRQQPNLTDQALINRARELGMAVPQFLDHLARQQENQELRAIQALTARASLYELWQEYLIANESMKLQVAAYPVEAMTDRVTVTDAELQQYLDENKEQFRVPDQRRYAFAKVEKESLRDAIEVTSQALQVYYEQNRADYAQAAGFKARELFAPLSADRSTTAAIAALEGAREAAAATTNWTDLATSLTEANENLVFYGRETPWLSADDPSQRSELYMRRVATLTTDTVSSPILDTGTGVYLVQVIERREAGVPPLAEVYTQVEQAYRAERLDAIFDETYAKWQEAREKAQALSEFATAVGVDDQLTTRVASSDVYIPDIGSLAQDRDYITRQLGLNELSDVIKLPDSIAVLQIVEETEAHDASLDEVREQVETAIKRERAAELARTEAEQSLALVESGAQFEIALAGAPRKAYTTESFKRFDPVPELGAPMLDFTTQTLQLNVGRSGVSPYGYSADDPQGYAVWRVEELTEPTLDQFAGEREQFERDYLQLQRETLLREWLADLRKRAEYELTQPGS